MGEVIPFLVQAVSVQAFRDKSLVDATIKVLGTSANLARAVQDLAEVFVRLDGVIAENPGNACIRRPIDVVVDQDRERLLVNMRDLLEGISEYTSGIEHRMRCTLDGPGNASRL